MKRYLTIALYSLVSMGLYALSTTDQNTALAEPTSIQTEQAATLAEHTKTTELNDVQPPQDAARAKYTFGDFFDALDLPTVLGVGFTPNGIEGATFNSSMRLVWRHHKNYGVYAFISFDTHSNTYDSLRINGTNVRTGEVWYYEIGMGVGYRIPLVKDLRAFFQQPYFHNWDFFVSIEPGVSIPYVKTVEPLASSTDAEPAYRLKDKFSAVATLRFAAGVEWFIVPNFGVFAELGYIQHLTPTIIEQAAIDQGKIRHPSGPMVASIGLSLFFK